MSYIHFHQSHTAHQEQHSFQEQLNRQAIKQALNDLAAALEPQSGIDFAEEDTPLLAAMGAIARVLGITLHPPSDRFNRNKNSIDVSARAFQMRVRRVRLSENWWCSISDPLLAYLGTDRMPVALLPVEQGYVLFNPMVQTQLPLNASVAAELSGDAYVFYRALPATRLTALNLLRFGIRGYKREISRIFAIGVGATLVGMIPLQLTAFLVNDVIPSGDRALLWQLGLILVVGALGQFIFQIAQNILIIRIESRADSVLQAAIWDRLLKLSPTFFRQYSSGDLVKRVLSIQHIHQKLGGATQRTLLSSVFALFNLSLMMIYSQSLALIGIGLAALMATITIALNYLTLNQSRQQQTLKGVIQGLAVQLISGAAKLRIAMAEERAFAVWAKQHSQQLKCKNRLQQMSDTISIVNEILPLASSALLFGLAVPLLQQAQLTLGAFLAFNYAFGMVIKGVIDLSNTVTDLVDILPTLERIQPILQAKLEADITKTQPAQLTGHLALNKVSFHYSEQGSLVLKDVSLYAEPGEFIAIVGPSGSGKSTILRLLLGFETPTSGVVSYDDKDLAELNLQAVRKMLGVVLQNGQIGAGSVFETIAAGALVSLDEAWEAARIAGLAEEIEQMPMEMHTMISEGGSNLSGGQRQRLLIARALVSKPKILLMDEATSALDNRTQAIVAKHLKTLNVTRIVIAHRLSTIQNADRIYVMNEGRIEQVGTFVELMSEDGVFIKLASRQR